MKNHFPLAVFAALSLLITSLLSCDSDISEVVENVNIYITTPQAGSTIYESPYENLNGTFTGTIPQGVTLWVLAKDPFNYYLMYPESQIIRKQGTWSQSNVRFNTEGSWEIYVCLANASAARWLEAYGRRGDYKGFHLIDVVGQLEIMTSVKVEKR